MQVLRKKGTESLVWPYHPLLAGRPDMETIIVADPGHPPTASEPPADTGEHKNSGEVGTAETKATKPSTVKTIKAWLKSENIDVPSGANKGDLKKLLDKHWK